jgi:hypothetical protein
MGAPLGYMEGGSSTRDYDRLMQGGSRNRTFISEEAHCGGSRGRAPLLGTLEDMFRKVLDMGISYHRGPVGKPGGDSLARTFERK